MPVALLRILVKSFFCCAVKTDGSRKLYSHHEPTEISTQYERINSSRAVAKVMDLKLAHIDIQKRGQAANKSQRKSLSQAETTTNTVPQATLKAPHSIVPSY